MEIKFKMNQLINKMEEPEGLEFNIHKNEIHFVYFKYVIF